MQQVLHRHAFGLAIVLAILAAFGVQSFLRAQVQVTDEVNEPVIAEMGVEHALPLSLSMEISSLQGVGLLDITHEGEETIFISLPMSWSRKEVRGVSLSSVREETSSFGFTRWRFPEGASVTFGLPKYPDSLLLHNPSEVSLKINVTQVNLNEGTVTHDIILVQESPVALW